MPLPSNFQFSASSLQDYVDCPRRFQLRYLHGVSWPAPDMEPIEERERHGRLARQFHQLVHQHGLGLPAERLSAFVHDPELERWWRAYLAFAPRLEDARVAPEVTLSTPVAGYRLMARYDAIATRAGQAGEPASGADASLLVLDWKTYRRRPSRAWLAQRMQSRVYPLVLVEAGPSLFDRFPAPEDTRTVRPENVEMRYWFAEYPDQPESFRYDTNAYQADREYLAGLIEEIAERVRLGEQAAGAGRPSAFDDVWTLGHDTEACRYCNYRSLCDRGEAAGDPSAAPRAGLAAYVEDEQEDYAAEGETDFGFDLDWGQVQEIVY